MNPFCVDIRSHSSPNKPWNHWPFGIFCSQGAALEVVALDDHTKSDISDIKSFFEAQLRCLHIGNIPSRSHDFFFCESPHKFAHNSVWPVRSRARRNPVSRIDVKDRNILYSQSRKQFKAKFCSLLRGFTLGNGRHSNNFNIILVASMCQRRWSLL